MKKWTFFLTLLALLILLSACQAGGGISMNHPTEAPPLAEQLTPSAADPTLAPEPSVLPTERPSNLPTPTERPTEPTIVVEPREPQPLSDDMEAEMQAHFREKFHLEHDCRLEYFGCYEDCYVVFTNSHTYFQAVTYEGISGYDFWYSSSQHLTVYRSGQSLELKEAWEQGWLSNEAMAQLHAWYKSQNASLYG